MKFKKLFQKDFLSHIKKILFYYFKLKYLNQTSLLSHIKNTQLFSCEHHTHTHTLMDFQSHIKKIKYFSNIYIVNFDIS
jgi:hypothetical protein